jgi:hypothetical protein
MGMLTHHDPAGSIRMSFTATYTTTTTGLTVHGTGQFTGGTGRYRGAHGRFTFTTTTGNGVRKLRGTISY